MILVRAVIIDDERYAGERLKKLLSSFPEIEVTGVFTSSKQGLAFIKVKKPDLLFLDVELDSNTSAFDILLEISGYQRMPEIILVTAHSHYSIKAIKNDVFDYLLKPVDIDELKNTIDRYLRHIKAKPVRSVSKMSMLSEREKTVLAHVLNGKSSEEIASIMFLSINTVHTHRRNILKKTGTHSIIELIRFCDQLND